MVPPPHSLSRPNGATGGGVHCPHPPPSFLSLFERRVRGEPSSCSAFFSQADEKERLLLEALSHTEGVTREERCARQNLISWTSVLSAFLGSSTKVEQLTLPPPTSKAGMLAPIPRS